MTRIPPEPGDYDLKAQRYYPALDGEETSLIDMTKEQIDWRYDARWRLDVFRNDNSKHKEFLEWAASLTKDEWERFQLADKLIRPKERDGSET